MSATRLGLHGEVLVRPVREAHADVVDDVGPLPAGLAGDRRGAVAEVLEHRGEARPREPLVARERVGVADPVVALGEVDGVDLEVVVEADRGMAREQPPGARLLGVAHLDRERRDAVRLAREVEDAVVAAGLEVAVRAVATVAEGAAGARLVVGHPGSCGRCAPQAYGHGSRGVGR